MKGRFIVENIDVSENRARIRYTAEGGLGRFFNTETFYVEYSSDISDVPTEIVLIPLLANVAPVCWATDSEIHVPSIDAEFVDSLEEVRDGFSELYPMFTGSSSIHGERVNMQANGSGESGMLFSGGVDSLATFIRHRDEKPTLFLAQGIDIDLDQDSAWNRTLNYAKNFADTYDTEVQTMKTNCYSFVSRQMLSAHFGEEITDNSWWSGVQHGMGLLGLCAPIAYKQGLSDLYIGSTHTESFDRPWGSHPKVDNQVFWRGTQCHHDSHDITRQQKIQVIADHSEDKNSSLQIRSCFNSSDGGNCGVCEKCCRTIIGLDLVDVVPSDYGFPVELDQQYYDHVQMGFEDGRWRLGYDELYMWTDLQNHITEEVLSKSGPRADFYRWLSSLNLREYRQVRSTSTKNRLLWWTARKVPKPVFDLVYSIYNRVT
ncbi:hypothetical protein PM032_17995 [Halorubrum ezzemoulense]|uniref:hypothetical protein n=1 Tax=Halorubrum ezzemoulense TaxID=337243 RepID=UPI00232EE8CC|nr:hypothetical protein [Halorubrum ezzemoulense]MDB2272859.1 hypothetical protein [Halorubrum ezzemoulense]